MLKYDSDNSSLTLDTVRGQGASSAPSEWVELGQSAHVQEPGPYVSSTRCRRVLLINCGSILIQ